MAKLALKPGAADMITRLSGLRTEEAIAGAIGVSYSTWNRVKNGETPSGDFAAGVVAALGIPFDSFIEAVGDNRANEKAA